MLDLIDLTAEGIEQFMALVPGEDEREWTSQAMAKSLLDHLATNGLVRLSENQEMPHITEDIAKLSLELLKEGADVFTAGAGGMWEAVKQVGFRCVEPLTGLQSERK